MFEILDTIKPALRELITELRKEYAYASVLAVADDARSWRVGKSGVSIGTSGLGGGDGFVAGLLYSILKGWEPAKMIGFGWATGALATTMLGDYATPVDEDQVWNIYKGNARVKR